MCAGVLFWATTAAADEPPPFPEYPAFRPGKIAALDQKVYGLLVLDNLEVSPLADDVPGAIEGFWRLGNAYNSFWLKLEAEGLLSAGEGEAEAQALYSRLITAFFDVQAGLRVDAQLDDDGRRARPQVVLGMEGLAPYWFELEPALFVSLEGHFSARLEASYDLLITQRLVLQPEVEVNVALQEVEDWGVGSGVNDIDLGLRLRYEIVREIAPYLGITWIRRFAGTADLARARGEAPSEGLLVAGARLWW
jgi:copper resistance protein B